MNSTTGGIVDQLRAAIAAAEGRGMSRRRIALAAGMRVTNVTRIVTGENRPRLDTAERVAAAVGASLSLAGERPELRGPG